MWYVRAFSCGAGLLIGVRSALGLLQQRTADAMNLPSRPSTRCNWYYLHKNFVPLILHHRITARIVNVSSSERASIRFEWSVRSTFKMGRREKTAVVDKVAVEFRWPAAVEAVFDSGCFE